MGPSGTMGGNIRIFLELTKRWLHKFKINVVTHEEGFKTCQYYGLKDANYHILNLGSRYLHVPRAMGFYAIIFQIIKMIEAMFLLLSIKEVRFKKKCSVIYSATDFWPDVMPALVLKLRFKNKIKWIAAFWLAAPSPFSKESPYKGRWFIKGLLFYLYQLPIYRLINRYANLVFVTSEPDVERFITKNRDRSKILVVRGGVDVNLSEQVREPEHKAYDAVFIGRFHLQKGVLELIDIWELVMKKKRDAKLAMIGCGPLEDKVKEKIRKHGLENNIKLFGFQDGVDKIKIFKSSRIVVHPAIFDSGGMAACEAMAAGLPGVSFDLEALKTYYPKGIIKTPCFDLEAFAENILVLLNDERRYQETRKDALEWSKEWDWDKRALEILAELERV
ncbi:hypothetical protein HKBW3S06_01326, partial [Candidatus Hakubella thermalkaliphila]